MSNIDNITDQDRLRMAQMIGEMQKTIGGQKIYGAISAIMNEIEPVAKTQRNDAQKYNYRGIDQLYNTLIKLLAKHKVFTTVSLTERVFSERKTNSGGTMLHAQCIFDVAFWAEDGSSVTCRVPSEGMDSGDKASNKAITAAHKYAMITTFSIPTADIDDGDATSPEPTVAAQRAQPRPQPQGQPPQQRPPNAAAGIQKASDKQIKAVYAISKKFNLNLDDMICDALGVVKRLNDLTVKDASAVLQMYNATPVNQPPLSQPEDLPQ